METFKVVLTFESVDEILWQGSILPFLQTRQPGKDVRKDACPDIILLARSKLCNN